MVQVICIYWFFKSHFNSLPFVCVGDIYSYNDEEEEEEEEKKDEQLKENLMSSRVDVVTVKSHPPVSLLDRCSHSRLVDVSTVDVVKQLSLTPQEPDQHSVDNCWSLPRIRICTTI